MCGRSSLTKSEKELEERFKATFYSEDLEKYNPLPNYNVAPTHVMPIITNKDPEHFKPLRWGLIPYWAKDIKIGYKMINARKETVAEKAAFKQALSRRRCLVPMDGFYEWKKNGKQKTAYRIHLLDQDLFCCAGLWESWKAPSGDWIDSFTILTQPPSHSISHIHDRMPAILTHDQERAWLDTDLPVDDALSIIAPYPDDLITSYQVSSRVGKVTENDAQLIDPIDHGPTTEQAVLF